MSRKKSKIKEFIPKWVDKVKIMIDIPMISISIKVLKTLCRFESSRELRTSMLI